MMIAALVFGWCAALVFFALWRWELQERRLSEMARANHLEHITRLQTQHDALAKDAEDLAGRAGVIIGHLSTAEKAYDKFAFDKHEITDARMSLKALQEKLAKL